MTMKRTHLKKEIKEALKNNYVALTFGVYDKFVSFVDGKISALCGILEFMEEQDNEE